MASDQLAGHPVVQARPWSYRRAHSVLMPAQYLAQAAGRRPWTPAWAGVAGS